MNLLTQSLQILASALWHCGRDAAGVAKGLRLVAVFSLSLGSTLLMLGIGYGCGMDVCIGSDIENGRPMSLVLVGTPVHGLDTLMHGRTRR